MDISIYFQPAYKPEFKAGKDLLNENIGDITDIHNQSGFPDLDGVQVAIIGVLDDRNSNLNKGCGEGPDEVRKYLFSLSKINGIRIADLGNIYPGATAEDTWFALSSSIHYLIKKNIFPLIIGGSQDLTYANYLGYEKLEQTVNMVTVDSHLDLGSIEDELSSRSYLGKIILHQPNFLFNYCNISLQSHFADPKTLELIEKLFFDNMRLGELRKDITDAEPLIRNADIFSFDISAVRYADAPGNATGSPNGLFGEEACQLCRYAGMSDKLTSAGFYEFNPKFDRHGQTAHLVAQMIWYMIDGIASRKKDFPVGERSNFTRFRVTAENFDHELVFYKSNKSDRWWMHVPYPPDQRLKFERHHMVPCTYKDYQSASSGEMPDLWWKTYQKLS
jgi:formiminoglutamase